jgi:CheY-like chemotaxis protein
VNQKVIGGILQKRGHDVVVVSDGRAAVDQWLRQRFDIILMDVHMPGTSGAEATNGSGNWRHHERSHPHHCPYSFSDEGDRERCLDAGMDDYPD